MKSINNLHQIWTPTGRITQIKQTKKLRDVIQDPQHLTHIVIQLKACLVLVKG